MVTLTLVKFVTSLFLFAYLAASYEVPISDADYERQVCSGMWSGPATYINVSFDSLSHGQVAMVIYEWADAQYLGKVINPADDDSIMHKTYVCTSYAVAEGSCSKKQLGQFILDLPPGRLINDTSFWSARVELPSQREASSGMILRDGPVDLTISPHSRRLRNGLPLFPMPQLNRSTHYQPATFITGGFFSYSESIQYIVRRTGYYCVAIVPGTIQDYLVRNPSETPNHPSYRGSVLFKNNFKGSLPATDYPKVNFYLSLTFVYCAFAAAWCWLCYKHEHELLPIQYYLSSLVGLLAIEMLATWTYYRYLNAHGRNKSTLIFLVFVAVLGAARNALSFFMLLVVSMGLNVVRDSLGKTMLKCQLLACAHFIFGVMYSMGIVELQLESTSAFVLLIFVIPLALTLSGFLLWIMYALKATIIQLQARKQWYKLRKFRVLNFTLYLAIMVIAIFFVVSSFSFSGRLAEDYAAKSWRLRWLLLDGWLALLYLQTFTIIAVLWRPTANNRRLAMSDELAQDEQDAEDYDLESLDRRVRAREEDDNATLVGGRSIGPNSSEEVVFEIGEEEQSSDTEDNVTTKKRRRSGGYQRQEQQEVEDQDELIRDTE